MKFELKDQNILVYQEEQLSSEFFAAYDLHYPEFQSYNIIFFPAKAQVLTSDFSNALFECTKAHQHHKKSFVVVSAHWISNELPEELVCVPTLQEAIDLIEMDEMQRDLGF